MRRNASYSLLLIAVLLGDAICANAQLNWKLYTPSDRRFSVELPAKPSYQRRSIAGIVGALPGPVDGITVIDSYNLPINEPNTSLRINVYSVSDRDTYQQFEKKRAASPQNPYYLKDEPVELNGLHGREYIYQKGKLASRLLIVFADHLVYTIAFSTESDKGVARGAIDRIFSSFRPTP